MSRRSIGGDGSTNLGQSCVRRFAKFGSATHPRASVC